jgi:EpsI family protein
MKLIVALTLIVAAEIAVRNLRHGLLEAPATPLRHSLREMPMDLASWKGSDVELDPQLYRRTGADEMINRTYQNPVGDKIEMNLGLWLNYEVAIPHKAEICYPAAGWEIVSHQVLRVAKGSDDSFPAKLLLLSKHGERITVLYWVAFADQIALDDGDVRQVLQSTVGVGKLRPAAVKCLLQTSGDDEERAQRQLVEFAAQVGPNLNNLQR